MRTTIPTTNQVRLRRTIAGEHGPIPAGAVVALPFEEAVELVDLALAEFAEVETATNERGRETAAMPRPRRR